MTIGRGDSGVLVECREQCMAEQVTSLPLPVDWTQQSLSELIRMWVRGQSTTAIAAALGISRSSVVGKVKRLQVDTARTW